MISGKPMTTQTLSRITSYITAILIICLPTPSHAGILDDLISSTIKILEYIERKKVKLDKKPMVLVCLRDLSYSQHGSFRDSDGDLLHKIKGRASFTLINVGGQPVTVTAVRLTIAGKWKDGRQGGMGSQYAKIEKLVPAKGVASINNVRFSSGNIVLQDKFWIKKPEVIHLDARWPGGKGPVINAVPAVTTEKGKWNCRLLDVRDGSAKQTLGENICY
ncbi:MAG: hypothetical protein MI892_27445 [Desulfobacterales bacterium]|nr:hypothetical protein [Desulfobacterales bacterium]